MLVIAGTVAAEWSHIWNQDIRDQCTNPIAKETDALCTGQDFYI